VIATDYFDTKKIVDPASAARITRRSILVVVSFASILLNIQKIQII